MTALTPEQREALADAIRDSHQPYAHGCLWSPDPYMDIDIAGPVESWLDDLTRERDEAREAVARVEALCDRLETRHAHIALRMIVAEIRRTMRGTDSPSGVTSGALADRPVSAGRGEGPRAGTADPAAAGTDGGRRDR